MEAEQRYYKGNIVDTINRSNEVHMPNNNPQQIGVVNLIGVTLYSMHKPIHNQLAENRITHFADIQPIELNEEWLRRLGFDNQIGFKYYHNKCNRLYVNTQSITNLWVGNTSGIVAMVDYVHHLQNLYYYLIGEELEIKP